MSLPNLVETSSSSEIPLLPDQLEDPVSFFLFPFMLGPAALIGLGALLTGPIGWSWTELNYHHFGKMTRATIEHLMTSIHHRFEMINAELEEGFTSIIM